MASESDESVTMEDYLEDVDDPGPSETEFEYGPVNISPPACQYCGEEFMKKGYWLNLHEAHCEERDDD